MIRLFAYNSIYTYESTTTLIDYLTLLSWCESESIDSIKQINIFSNSLDISIK